MPERLKPLRLPTALLFDWDGTLVDNWGVIHASLNSTLVAFGHEPWTREETMQRVSHSQRDSFPVLFGASWREARDLFYARFEERHLHDLEVLPGAETMIDRLARHGYWAGVVSNKLGRYVRREARHLGWGERFGALIGARDAEADKPSPEPIHLALAQGGLSAGPAVWLVGDSETDVLAARNAGVTSVLVRQQSANPMPLPDGLEADMVVDGLEALDLLLRECFESR